MTVPVPVSTPAVAGWSLVDWLDKSYSSLPAAGGTATITLDPLPSTDRWQLTHVVAGCTSTAATQLRLYLGDPTNNSLRDGSNTGNFDVADWAMGLWVAPGRSLVAVWTGCTNGAIGYLNLQANIYRQPA